MVCPHCGSKDTEIKSPPLIVFIPFFVPRTYYRCKTCGEEF